jgi:hypothetical protein
MSRMKSPTRGFLTGFRVHVRNRGYFTGVWVQIPPPPHRYAHFPRFGNHLNTRQCVLPMQGKRTGQRRQAGLQAPARAGNPLTHTALVTAPAALPPESRPALSSPVGGSRDRAAYGWHIHGDLTGLGYSSRHRPCGRSSRTPERILLPLDPCRCRRRSWGCRRCSRITFVTAGRHANIIAD